MDKSFQTVESMIRYWVMKEEQKQRPFPLSRFEKFDFPRGEVHENDTKRRENF